MLLCTCTCVCVCVCARMCEPLWEIESSDHGYGQCLKSVHRGLLTWHKPGRGGGINGSKLLDKRATLMAILGAWELWHKPVPMSTVCLTNGRNSISISFVCNKGKKTANERTCPCGLGGSDCTVWVGRGGEGEGELVCPPVLWMSFSHMSLHRWAVGGCTCMLDVYHLLAVVAAMTNHPVANKAPSHLRPFLPCQQELSRFTCRGAG